LLLSLCFHAYCRATGPIRYIIVVDDNDDDDDDYEDDDDEEEDDDGADRVTSG